MSEEIIIIESDSAQLKRIRERVDTYLREQAFDDKAREDVLVAVGEATANAIRHAYKNERGHEVRFTIEDLSDKVIFRVRDFGKKIELDKVKEPELPPVKPNGLGIYFMKTIMDSVEYNTSHKEGNEVIMTKKKPLKQGAAS